MLEKLMKKLNIKSVKIMLALLAVAAAGIIAAAAIFADQQRNMVVVLEGIDTRAEVYDDFEPLEAVPEQRALAVHVSGEVNNPGVFEFYEGARVRDAVAAAGGLTDYADQNAINLARLLNDEDHIIVFSIHDNMPATATGGGTTAAGDDRININTASSEELQALSGIGPVIAGNIISHREARGGFETIEEIMNVSGIGERIFESIRDRIRTE